VPFLKKIVLQAIPGVAPFVAVLQITPTAYQRPFCERVPA
jgi:hypothetical protein